MRNNNNYLIIGAKKCNPNKIFEHKRNSRNMTETCLRDTPNADDTIGTSSN